MRTVQARAGRYAVVGGWNYLKDVAFTPEALYFKEPQAVGALLAQRRPDRIENRSVHLLYYASISSFQRIMRSLSKPPADYSRTFDAYFLTEHGMEGVKIYQ